MKKIMYMLAVAGVFSLGSCASTESKVEKGAEEVEDAAEDVGDAAEDAAEEVEEEIDRK